MTHGLLFARFCEGMESASSVHPHVPQIWPASIEILPVFEGLRVDWTVSIGWHENGSLVGRGGGGGGGGLESALERRMTDIVGAQETRQCYWPFSNLFKCHRQCEKIYDYLRFILIYGQKDGLKINT